MTFSPTPRQLRYIADVADAVNRIPTGGVHTDEAVLSAKIEIELPEGKIAEIVQDEKYDGIWTINLVSPPVPFSPYKWAADNVQEYADPVRKIAMIKGLRNAAYDAGAPTIGLQEAKDIVEDALQDKALADLRAKLVAEPDEDQAYARHRESLAETGSWFGHPGPLDEEPPF